MKNPNEHRIFRLLVLVLALMALICTSFPSLGKSKSTKSYSTENRDFLVNLFADNGFDRDFLKTVFYDSRLKRLPVVVERNVYNAENRERYIDFLSPYSIYMAKKFSRKWRSTLSAASLQFGVDTEILVAVLLVETGLGNVLGKYSIASVFSSILVEKESREVFCRANDSEDCQDEFVTERLALKSSWAQGELEALLTICQDGKIDPFKLKGSFAGAFGIPQFLPSSYLKWGFDADQSGSINLFLFPDAIYSAANYLKAHGWEMGLHQDKNKAVLFNYNNSTIYVDTVFQVAMRVRDESRKIDQNNSNQTKGGYQSDPDT